MRLKLDAFGIERTQHQRRGSYLAMGCARLRHAYHHTAAPPLLALPQKMNALKSHREQGLLRASLSCHAHSPMSSVSASATPVTGRSPKWPSAGVRFGSDGARQKPHICQNQASVGHGIRGPPAFSLDGRGPGHPPTNHSTRLTHFSRRPPAYPIITLC